MLQNSRNYVSQLISWNHVKTISCETLFVFLATLDEDQREISFRELVAASKNFINSPLAKNRKWRISVSNNTFFVSRKGNLLRDTGPM